MHDTKMQKSSCKDWCCNDWLNKYDIQIGCIDICWCLKANWFLPAKTTTTTKTKKQNWVCYCSLLDYLFTYLVNLKRRRDRRKDRSPIGWPTLEGLGQANPGTGGFTQVSHVWQGHLALLIPNHAELMGSRTDRTRTGAHLYCIDICEICPLIQTH